MSNANAVLRAGSGSTLLSRLSKSPPTTLPHLPVMTAMSKRAQARTERELHDLLRAPGNSTCADCSARNPSWASWNLGVFLCMRCASIHRKMGTHISKVKSLSMDTWTNEQLESMKKNGNLAVNKQYNPKNKRPDMPLDADEVDGAMERFIRKKYQEKSLSDGRPEVPSRDDAPPLRSKSPEASPPPALPSKKGRFFGFGLRASSSAYPLSKHDKKGRNEPRVDNAFRISSEDYTSSSGNTGTRSELSDHALQAKLSQLRDMGFTDTERNTNVLKRLNGDVERAVETLVKLGPPSRKVTPTPPETSGGTGEATSSTSSRPSAPQTSGSTSNPFDQLDQRPSAGLSMTNTPAQAPPTNLNPWQTAMSNQQTTGLEQQFSNMQVAPVQNVQSQGAYYAPAVPSPQHAPQQYAMTASPASTSNPFVQAPLSAHSTGNNPYVAHVQNGPAFAPSTNPFLNMTQTQVTPQGNTAQSFNPFGLPPASSQQPAHGQLPQQQQQQQPGFFDVSNSVSQPGFHPQAYGNAQQASQQPMSPYLSQSSGTQSPPPMLPNFQYGQPQQQQQFDQLYRTNSQPLSNPYQQQQQIPQQMMPQQTGRYDKNSILALFNYPQHNPAQPLASIPEPTNDYNQSQNQQAFSQQQMASPAPSSTVYGGGETFGPPKRASTMPVSAMHSGGGLGSRNPFMNSAHSSGSSTPALAGQQFNAYPPSMRHASAESMSVNNPYLQDGRHSPDAFASLSARHMG